MAIRKAARQASGGVRKFYKLQELECTNAHGGLLPPESRRSQQACPVSASAVLIHAHQDILNQVHFGEESNVLKGARNPCTRNQVRRPALRMPDGSVAKPTKHKCKHRDTPR